MRAACGRLGPRAEPGPSLGSVSLSIKGAAGARPWSWAPAGPDARPVITDGSSSGPGPGPDPSPPAVQTCMLLIQGPPPQE